MSKTEAPLNSGDFRFYIYFNVGSVFVHTFELLTINMQLKVHRKKCFGKIVSYLFGSQQNLGKTMKDSIKIIGGGDGGEGEGGGGGGRGGGEQVAKEEKEEMEGRERRRKRSRGLRKDMSMRGKRKEWPSHIPGRRGL
jgi:hypothetical protein